MTVQAPPAGQRTNARQGARRPHRQHTANLTAAARLAKLFGSYGVGLVERAYKAILDRSEANMRAALAKVPAGSYSFEDHLDDYRPATPPVRMAVDITFDGKGEVEFDFSRSSDTVPAALNSYMLAQSVLNPQDNGERLHSKETRQIKRGDILSFRLSGAGGYGAPAERDPTAIARDVAEGYVSKEAALRDYGWSAAGED
jgi:N-methylhydantoinase B/oxoprolinase/acetone carboxylase alpha subunit